MTNYESFVKANKSLIIAPAGHGKTHTISECLKHTSGKQLILTHTHAGISSIKAKLKKANIPSENYSVETITSFAQKYVLSFYIGEDIPEQDDKVNYFPFIVDKAKDIFKLKILGQVIKISYQGLFVDEYQDCTESQHEIIIGLSNILPTHILGDYLQGIFNFKPEDDPIIDLEDKEKLSEFYDNFQELDTPWRWIIGGNIELGNDLKSIREKLRLNEPLNIQDYTSIKFQSFGNLNGRDVFIEISKIINENQSLLIIDPLSYTIAPRIKFIQKFYGRITLLESIDEPLFYQLSKKIDNFTEENIYNEFINVGLEIFQVTEFKNWFNVENGKLKNKTSEDDKIIMNSLKYFFDNLKEGLSSDLIGKLFLKIFEIPAMKVYRKELFFSLINSLKESNSEGITVYESMVNKRNLFRRVGNRIEGKCIGTTLLTKGLEFDTVLIVNAHKFKCPKDFYVAITRASKKLIIFGDNNIIGPFVS